MALFQRRQDEDEYYEDDGFDEMNEGEEEVPDEAESEEETAERIRDRVKLAFGVGNLGAVIAGTVVILALVALLLGVAGLVSSQDPVTGETVVNITNEASVQRMIWNLFSLFPAIIALLMLFLLRLYPLRK